MSEPEIVPVVFPEVEEVKPLDSSTAGSHTDSRDAVLESIGAKLDAFEAKRAVNSLALVEEFHKAFGLTVASEPTLPEHAPEDLWVLDVASLLLQSVTRLLRTRAANNPACARLALTTEEVGELCDALIDCDKVKVLDALLDIQYINDGSVHTFGMGPVFDTGTERVHTSNMSKLGPDGKPILNENGKVVKGPNYVPVDLTDLV